VPDATPIAGFELSRSDSPIAIAVSPPDLSALLPEDMSKAPPVTGQFSLRPEFKPRTMIAADPMHVYQRSELDQPIRVIERGPDPSVPNHIRGTSRALRVMFSAVVEPSGGLGHIRIMKTSGKPEFDQLMIEWINQWVMSPPMKGGKRVRCLFNEELTVNWSGGSVFSTGN